MEGGPLHMTVAHGGDRSAGRALYTEYLRTQPCHKPSGRLFTQPSDISLFYLAWEHHFPSSMSAKRSWSDPFTHICTT
jgi:hypothetical protein